MGRSSRYTVRFASPSSASTPPAPSPSQAPPRTALPLVVVKPPSQPGRSRLACHGCRVRHIKCDEQFPVCTQCRAKGLVCMPRGRPAQWQVETPWLRSCALRDMPALNRRLLLYWLENASHMMTLDPDNNPMSFPIVQQLLESDALVHALQSVSAAYERFYDPPTIQDALVERCKALQTVAHDLRDPAPVRPQTFLSVYMLGVSSPWIDYSPCSFGQEHLRAARAILEALLQQPDFADHPYRSFIIAAFVWWDMSCALLVDPADQMPLDTPVIRAAVASLQGKFCAILSHAIELVYELACLGRYCRRRYDDPARDLAREDAFETRLLAWTHSDEAEPVWTLNETFRLHGLVMLYRLGGRTVGSAADTEAYIRERSLSVLRHIARISTTSPVFKFAHIPLLNAAAELTAADAAWRTQVLDWCAILYSTNRSPVNHWAVQLLQCHWARKDAGDPRSWLHTMLHKNWRLNLG